MPFARIPLLLVLVPLVALQAGCSAPDDAPASDPAPAATNAASAPEAARDHARAEIAGMLQERQQAQQRDRFENGWWNDGQLAAELGLQPDQQQAIAALAANAGAARSERAARIRQAQQDYRGALVAGELERAREAARRHAALAAEQVLAQRLLAVDVLEALPPSQRAVVLRERPGLVAGLARGRYDRSARAARRGEGDAAD